jgi:hypothetical protein
MNSWFHLITLYRRPPAAFFKQDMIGADAQGRQGWEGLRRKDAKGQN